MRPRRLITLLFLCSFALGLPATAWGAPENQDENTYLKTMLELTQLTQDPTLVTVKGSTDQLGTSTAHLQEVKAYWMQSVHAPPRYQYINDDFGNYLNNEIDAMSLDTEVSAQVDQAKIAGWSSAQAKANAQVELDQSNVYWSASDGGFNAFTADLHAEMDGN